MTSDTSPSADTSPGPGVWQTVARVLGSAVAVLVLMHLAGRLAFLASLPGLSKLSIDPAVWWPLLVALPSFPVLLAFALWVWADGLASRSPAELATASRTRFPTREVLILLAGIAIFSAPVLLGAGHLIVPLLAGLGVLLVAAYLMFRTRLPRYVTGPVNGVVLAFALSWALGGNGGSYELDCASLKPSRLQSGEPLVCDTLRMFGDEGLMLIMDDDANRLFVRGAIVPASAD